VHKKGSGRSLDELATALRALPQPVIGRVSEDRLLLDLRCLEDQAAFAAQLPRLQEALA
jgi:L-seryl-tRNA(Ser) seleniumtransferase